MPRHVVILPYYCEEEVDRYLQIGEWMVRNCRLPLDCTFLLAASPRAQTSDRLLREWSKLGECVHLKCPTQVFGYPAGPTAMFWDAMDHIAGHFKGNGFALWFESDMVAVRPDWLDLLAADWDREAQRPLLMGCYVPPVFKFRWLRRKKLLLDPHINGGACYALDFARRMPAEARNGTFDMAIYQHALRAGGAVVTNRIGFSTLGRVRRDVMAGRKCLLHGFMQDKNRFIREAVRPVSAAERNISWALPLRESVEEACQRIRLCFFRRGPAVMLQNLLLAQKRNPVGRLQPDSLPGS